MKKTKCFLGVFIFTWILFAAFLLPDGVMAGSGNIQIDVVSFNIANGQGKPNDSKKIVGNDYLDLCVKKLDELKADLIGIQEVSRHRLTSGYISNDKYIAKKLNMHSFWDVAYSKALGLLLQQGNAILSRYKLSETKTLRYKSRGDTGGAASETRIAVISFVEIKGRKIAFVTTHLGFPEEARVGQVKELLKELSKIKTPLIVTGDFNTEIGSDSYKLMNERFDEAWELSGNKTKKITLPFKKDGTGKGIDHIFLSKGDFKVLKTYVLKSGAASDHNILVAELEMIARKEITTLKNAPAKGAEGNENAPAEMNDIFKKLKKGGIGEK